MKLTKIDQFTIPETGVRVTILGDVKTFGKEYAESHLVWPRQKLSLKENEKH